MFLRNWFDGVSDKAAVVVVCRLERSQKEIVLK